MTEGENGFVRILIRISHIAKELWALMAAVFGLLLLFVHLDTKTQVGDTLRERDREERLEAKQVQAQLDASQRLQDARIEELHREIASIRSEVEEIRLKQNEVRRKIKIEP